MSEGRRFNLRSRKQVDYSDPDFKELDDEEVLKPKARSKKSSKETKTPKSRSKLKHEKSTNSIPHVADSTKRKVKTIKVKPLQLSGFSSDDDFVDEKLHVNNDPTSFRDKSTTSKIKRKEPSKIEHTPRKVVRSVRKNAPEENLKNDNNTLYYTTLNPETGKEFYSSGDEPYDTIPEFGEISPIQHEESILFMKERRDKLMTGGRATKEPRPVLKRQRHKSKEDVMRDFQSSLKWQILGSVLCLIVISVLAVAAVLKLEDARSTASASRVSRLESHMEKLKVQFPSQTYRFWNVLGGASFAHVTQPLKVEQPIVVLIAGTRESAETMSCLATKIAAMFDHMFESTTNPIMISGGSYIKHNSDVVKREIDKKLKTGFETGAKTAVIHFFDNIPPCSILLFHSYCENNNAPYKDVAIILTMQLGLEEVDVEELKPIEFDSKVSKHLKKRWSDCPDDLPSGKQDAMLARVANNIARVKAEDKFDLKTVCR